MKKYISLLQQWSIPLIGGVLVALLVANIDTDTKNPKDTLYYRIVHTPLNRFGEVFNPPQKEDAAHSTADQAHAELAAPADGSGKPEAADAHGDHGGHPWWEHYITMHFLVNEIFMVLFFGIAAKEITEACLPGGALNPVTKAINPLLGTIGGVLGPVGAYLLLNSVMGKPEWENGWGIPTATDIAMAWLVARAVFGAGHPAVSFLLLLAVADDAIGLGIIAFKYPNPLHPTEWINALWILPGMAAAFIMRKMGVKHWAPYIYIGGAFSWWGLYSAHLHPALALVLIVPFLPGPKKDLGMFVEEADYDAKEKEAKAHHEHAHSPLEQFEHTHKIWVDFGLFFFAFANAGVQFSGISNLTWIVLFALLIGKAVGIFGFSALGALVGFPLPTGMTYRHLFVAGVVAAIGLTVALFVAAQAFVDLSMQGAAKMGALFSAGNAFVAIVLGILLKTKSGNGQPAESKPDHPAS